MAATAPHRLSKSRYCSGLQCHRQLWWRTHEPSAPELVPDVETQARFDAGTRVGEVARGYVPGGVLIDRPHADFAGRVADTQQAIASGAHTLYEASFSAGGVFVAVDILTREGGGWRVIEVKSSTRLKDEHLPDVAVQVWTLRQAGLDVVAADVMVLNRDCRHPDLSNLFQRVDVTAVVESMLDRVGPEVLRQSAMLAGPCPEVEIGPHCSAPYACPFTERCWPSPPEHAIETLYNSWRQLPDLRERGYETIHQLPAGLALNAAAERQRRAVAAGELVVEPGLARALEPLVPPLAHLDFETLQPAIPVWPRMRPYDQAAVQFSVHREHANGGHSHSAWVARTPGDPRAELARRLVEACDGARVVVAYNASFERDRIRELAESAPTHAAALRDIEARLVDLLPVVRNHVYHPEFGGSFSLKAVLPALVPGLGYDDLAIGDGQAASLALHRLLLEPGGMRPDEHDATVAALLAYCERDTFAMVKLLERLRELARSSSDR